MKHKGQWNILNAGTGYDVEAWCSCIRGPELREGGCKEKLDQWEIERRINEYEQLKEENKVLWTVLKDCGIATPKEKEDG